MYWLEYLLYDLSLSSKTPPKPEFVEWCRRDVSRDKYETDNYSDFRNKSNYPTGNESALAYIDHVNDIINKCDKPHQFQFNGFNYDIKLIGGMDSKVVLRFILDQSNTAHEALIEEFIIDKITIRAAPNFSKITLKSCKIREIDISPTGHGGVQSILISDCSIGIIKIGSNVIKGLHIKNSCVLDIDCPPPESENPFSGNVRFQNVYLPRNPMKHPISSAQPYRNMRHHLRDLENEITASQFHAAELSVERKMDDSSIVAKFLSWNYEIISDYGASIARPLVYLILLSVLSTVIIYSQNGAELTYDKTKYVGWQTKLVNSDDGKFMRALVLTGQQAFNPFGIINSKKFVTAKNGYMLTWSIIHSVVSTTLIALFILAVRRRFKLKA